MIDIIRWDSHRVVSKSDIFLENNDWAMSQWHDHAYRCVQLDCSLVALQAGLLFTPVDACSLHLLFIVVRLCRPTLRIHSWILQHTPARTYCSLSSCMRSKSQLRLPCQLISIILLTISSSFLILLIDEQLRLPCRLLVLYCSPLAVLSLYCSSMSSCDFHVNF
jgi:hypothetical protein